MNDWRLPRQFFFKLSWLDLSGFYRNPECVIKFSFTVILYLPVDHKHWRACLKQDAKTRKLYDTEVIDQTISSFWPVFKDIALDIWCHVECDKYIYYTSPMFYERWFAKKVPTYSMLDSVLLFLTNIPHVTNVGLTENPTFLTWLMLDSLRIQHSSRD